VKLIGALQPDESASPAESMPYKEAALPGAAIPRSETHIHGFQSKSLHERVVQRFARNGLDCAGAKALSIKARDAITRSTDRREYIRKFDQDLRTGKFGFTKSMPVTMKSKGGRRTRPMYCNGSTKHTFFGTYSPRKLATQEAVGIEDFESGSIAKECAFNITTKSDAGWSAELQTAQQRKIAMIRKQAASETARAQTAPRFAKFEFSLSNE
jgi:hypothetical protein